MYFIIRCILINNPVLVFYEVYFKITLRNRYNYVFDSAQLQSRIQQNIAVLP